MDADSSRWFNWLVRASILVGIGVALEAPEATITLKRWYRLWRGKDVSPENEKSLVIPIAYLGLLLVVVGVAGEGIFEFLSSRSETALRAHDEHILGETESEVLGSKQQMADAVSRVADAEQRLAVSTQRAANAEAELEQLRHSIPSRRLSQEQKKSLRQLLDREPKGGVSLSSLIEDKETEDFATDIGLSLTDAGYSVSTSKLTVPIERPPDGDPVGIEFSVRPGVELTPAAIRVRRAFFEIGIPSIIVESPNADLYRTNIIVGHKAIPTGKQIPIKK